MIHHSMQTWLTPIHLHVFDILAVSWPCWKFSDQEDSKYMYLHIHNEYFDIINDNWTQGWEEANSKTKHPKYRHPYMLKFAVLRGNEEYYNMREAKWDEKQAVDSEL